MHKHLRAPGKSVWDFSPAMEWVEEVQACPLDRNIKSKIYNDLQFYLEIKSFK